jgi:hypothetical protein
MKKRDKQNLREDFIDLVKKDLKCGFRTKGRNSANLELLIDKTSSIYLYVKLKALAS